MSNTKRFNLSFNLDKEEERKAAEILDSLGRKKSAYIADMIINGNDAEIYNKFNGGNSIHSLSEDDAIMISKIVLETLFKGINGDIEGLITDTNSKTSSKSKEELNNEDETLLLDGLSSLGFMG